MQDTKLITDNVNHDVIGKIMISCHVPTETVANGILVAALVVKSYCHANAPMELRLRTTANQVAQTQDQSWIN